jgi:hypothetical protein
MVKADEQTRVRLLEPWLLAIAVLCDDVSDDLGMGGDTCLVGHVTDSSPLFLEIYC